MGVIMRQLGPADRASVEAFCGANLAAASKAVPPHEVALSLMAQEGQQIIALALTRRGQPGSPSHIVLVASPDHGQLVPELVDKAILKLTSARLRKCRVTFADGREPDDLWRTSRLAATV